MNIYYVKVKPGPQTDSYSLYKRKSALVVTGLQTGCNKVVVMPISGCIHTACSQLLRQVWNKLLSPCYYKVDEGNRPAATRCS